MASKILIVEDNLINRALFRAVLLTSGFNIVEVENGAEGVQKAREHRPDLILMDLQMPVMNGYEAGRALKQDPVTADIPIIAVTAFPMDGDRDKVLAAGFDHYLSKPFIVQELPEIIRSFLPPEQTQQKH